MEIVLPLIDEHVVADPAWRYWLRDLAADRSRVMMPVSLDPTAYNMPSPIREMNFIRPAGLPLAPDNADGFRRVKRSLLKQVTEWMCRILLPRRRDAPTSDALMTEGLPKVSVFLSHAKADGTVPAKRIRDYIYSQTQLAAFYDENDIAFGSAFAHVIDRALDAGETAALIAVQQRGVCTAPVVPPRNLSVPASAARARHAGQGAAVAALSDVGGGEHRRQRRVVQHRRVRR